MFSLLTGFSPKIYIAIALILASVLGVSYVNSLKSDLEKTRFQLEDKEMDLEEANENNTKIIEAYEYSLKVQKEVAKEEAISLEQKETVVIKYKTLIKEVENRGEIKQDENSNFTIVTF